jgi:hypothetical protein
MNVPGFERGSTRIAWECLSEREQKLFERIEDLLREHGDGFGGIRKDALVENIETLNKGMDILLKRTFDLFFTVISPFLNDDKLYEWIFWGRFRAFLVTTLNIIEMRRREDAFLQQVQEKYGDDWPDDMGEPDYAGIGERDFDKALEILIDSSFVSSTKEEQPKDGSR